MTPVQVCLVAPFPPPYGGIAHWTSMVTAYADGRDDANITLVNTAPTWRSFHNLGIWLRIFGGGIQLVGDVFRLVIALRSRRFDAIHLTTSGHLASVRDAAICRVASWFGVPLVYHIRFGRIPFIAASKGLEWRVLSSVMRRCAAVIAIDSPTFDAIQRHVPEANVCQIPNCVNFARLPQAKPVSVETNRKALFLGWVVSTKGINELCEAWSKLQPKNWTLEIIGPVEQTFKSKLQAKFQSNSIEFLDLLPHAESMQRMAQCDLFILPSYTEGFPNAVVEAMALGRPIIATRVGAIPEMLHDDAGILVEARDTEDLAIAIQRVVSDPSLGARLGARAREKAITLYSLEVVFGSYVSLWKRVSKLSI